MDDREGPRQLHQGTSLTIGDVLRDAALHAPDSPALLSPGRHGLSYEGLRREVLSGAYCLRGWGIERNDCVAIVLPNGLDMAVAFLSVACAATCAPLNPDYTEREFALFLDDLNPKAIILPEGAGGAPARAAEARGIGILGLVPSPGGEAAKLVPGPGSTSGGSGPDLAQAGDVALMLHTSGTTSRPKQVALTHTNLLASAESIARTLSLSPSDRCLNVMPLFHIHGLVACVLASLWAGGSVVCTPGFQSPLILDWMAEYRPTWYSAVPTMHQSILGRATATGGDLPVGQLRFVRSSSAALPPQVMVELEETLGAPVIEAYGMTEASHQVCSNPLPPGRRKPGSVGLPAGPEVAIFITGGRRADPGEQGEVAIRGPNVIQGYLNNPEANRASFKDGWFSTGDLGYQDGDGYLFLTGRLKEVINRGGEKIMPREIDEALLDHPAVAQAVTFAVPDARLGEDVAAAVVLRPGASADPGELRRFAAGRVASFKVPRQILILDTIPKGPTGKLQRIGLAEKLGLLSSGIETLDPKEFTPARSELEAALAKIWREVLRVDQIGIHDRFLDLGGDSLLAMSLLTRISADLEQEISIIDFFDAPTIADQARLIENARHARQDPS